MSSTTLSDLPLREDLRGKEPYGAPQLDVPVRLNVNENAYPVPESVTVPMAARLGERLPHLNRYPDREFTRLRELLAGYLSATNAGVELSPEHIWAANGSNEVLAHVLQAFGGPGRRALGFVPSYSMHPLITTGTGSTWLETPRDADYLLDADAVVAAIKENDPDIVFLTTPNNPTGTALPLATIEAAYEAARGIVIVDEAYAEFAREGVTSALELLPGRPRLLVSRTMSKAFAFAGVRLGYLAADPAVCDALRLVRLPYHLSSLTQAAAEVALEHWPELLANVDRLKVQRDRIVDTLLTLGYRVTPSDANFVLFGGVSDPALLWRELLARGVLIRDIGIPGHLRVNAGTEDETTAFLDAVRELTEGNT